MGQALHLVQRWNRTKALLLGDRHYVRQLTICIIITLVISAGKDRSGETRVTLPMWHLEGGELVSQFNSQRTV